MKNLAFICSTGVLVCLLIACKPSLITQESITGNNQVIATADNGYKLTMPEFYHKLAASDVLKSGGIMEKDALSYYLDSILVDTLVGMRAVTVNLRDHYDYYFRFRENALRALTSAYYQDAIFKGIKVDSQEVLDYFEKHQNEFHVEEQILAYHIVITPYGLKKGKDSLLYKHLSNEELDETAKNITFDLRSKITSKETFEEIARQYSHDEFSARRGGQIEWAPRGFYAWPFDSLAFAAELGDIVGPYRDKDGWQILYIDDYVPAGVPALNDQIYYASFQRVLNEKTRDISFAIFDTLFAKINLKYNEELYDSNVYFVDKEIWAAIVNETDTIDFGELSSGEERVRDHYQVPNSTPDMKKELVRFLARRWVMVQQARKMKLDTLPEVKSEIDKHRQYYARLIVWSTRTNPKWEPSEEDLKSYYNQNLSKYVVPKPLKVQHILVNDLHLAEFLRDQANAGVDFLELADEFYIGEKEVRRDLANLGYIGPEDVSKEFFDAARSLRPGGVSRPVKTEYGYHIIKVLETKWSVPFDNAKGGIRSILKKEHEVKEKEAFKQGLFKQFRVKRTGNLPPLHFKPKSEREISA